MKLSDLTGSSGKWKIDEAYMAFGGMGPTTLMYLFILFSSLFFFLCTLFLFYFLMCNWQLFLFMYRAKTSCQFLIGKEWGESFILDTSKLLLKDLPLSATSPGGQIEFRKALCRL
jgi:hypothetical protein